MPRRRARTNTRNAGAAGFALLLLVGGCQPTVCWFSDGGPPPVPDAFVSPDSGAACERVSDVASGVEFRLTYSGLALEAGLDLDGLDNSPAVGGATVAGCGRMDFSGGGDNALGLGVGSWLTDLIEVPAPDDSVGVPSAVAGDTPPSIDASVAGLDSTRSGPCVFAQATVVLPTGESIAVAGQGTALHGRVDVVLDAPVPFPVPIRVHLPECGEAGCPTPLVLPVQLTHLRLVVARDGRTVEAGSMVGGRAFFEDCTGGRYDADGVCEGGDFELPNRTGTKHAVTAWAATTGLSPRSAAMVLESLRGSEDLHVEPNGRLSPCTGANNVSTNRNAISVALAIGGAAR